MTSDGDGPAALLAGLEATGWRVADRHRERFVRATPPREVYLEHGESGGRLRVDPVSEEGILAVMTFVNPLDPDLPGSASTDGLGGRLSEAHARIVTETATVESLEGVEDPATVARVRVPTSSTADDLEALAADLATVAKETTALHDAVLRTASAWDPGK